VGLLKEVLLLPLAPVRFTKWTVGQVVDAAERERRDPAAIRGELAELSRAVDAGEISYEEFDRREDYLLDLLDQGETGPSPEERIDEPDT
jgi:hypothetical protein